MIVLRLVLFILLTVMSMTAIGQQNSRQQTIVPPASCSVTAPPAVPFTPPRPYPGDVAADTFWLGTEKLWLELPRSGVWEGWRGPQPGRGIRSAPLTSKMFWWSVDYDPLREGNPDLKVTGRRLDDGETRPIFANQATNALGPPATAMVTGIYLPTPGCWEITGEYKDQKLSFVVWVTPLSLKPIK